MASDRPTVLLPPVGWRPPALTGSVKVSIVLHQLGYCGCDSCKPLAEEILRHEINRQPPPAGQKPMRIFWAQHIRFDHRPPIHEREWDPFLKDTIPPANDITFIRAVAMQHDRPVTAADVSRMAKVKRIRAGAAEHAAVMAAKLPGQKGPRKNTIQSRGFRK